MTSPTLTSTSSWKPARAPRAVSRARRAFTLWAPEAGQCQAQGGGEGQLGGLQQVGGDGHRHPGGDARREQAPGRPQRADHQGRQGPGDHEGVDEAEDGRAPEEGQDVLDEAVGPKVNTTWGPH